MSNVIERPLRPTSAYILGQQVIVHAMGSFYPGVLLKRTARTVTAAYVSGAGIKRSVTANPQVEYHASLRGGGSYHGPRILPQGEV